MIQTDIQQHGRLFDADAYLTAFDAVVTAVAEDADGCRVTLDRTAFFPEGGGQLSDVGTLDGYEVTDVQDTADGILHYVHASPSVFSVGNIVHGQVDAQVRLDAMQNHTAEHILSGLIHARYGYDNVGFHLGRDEMTIDTSGVLTKEQLRDIEACANAVVRSDLPVCIEYPTREQLNTLAYRSKIPLTGRVRIVRIEGVDCCACCAPHVRTTGQIGFIHITFAEKHRGGMRLYVKAGERAASYVRQATDELSTISVMLSAHMTESADAVRRLQAECKNITLAYKALLHEHMHRLAETLPVDETNPITLFAADTPIECVRTYLNDAARRVSSMVIALLPKADGFTYLIASVTVDLKTCIADINRALQGRGGGTSSMVQGSFASDEASIRSYFSSI